MKQLSLTQWIENNEPKEPQTEQLSLIAWIDGELVALLVEKKLQELSIANNQ